MDGLAPQFPLHPPLPNFGFNPISGTSDNIRNLLVIILVYLACLLIITYMYCTERKESQLENRQAGRYIWGNLSIISGTQMAWTVVHVKPAADIVVYGSHGKRLVNEDCVICQASFENGEECKVLRDCRHVYHKECIDEWIWRDGHCPLCTFYARVVRTVTRDLELGIHLFP